jgi:glycine/D-amino acid oxidase-like deaminating enzyme
VSADEPSRPRAAADRPPVGPVFWLEQALERDPGAACPPLAGTARADVCVVGGGFLGLWTALEILDRAPDTSVVLLEAQGCGFGASGRNGGWATSWNDELHGLVARFGAAHADWLAEQSMSAIDRIEAVASEEGIFCDLRRAGGLWAASTDAQLDVLAVARAAAVGLGRERYVVPLDAEQVRAATGSPVVRGGLRLPDSAALQPALLARGLRAVALRRGVRIHEGTRMVALERGHPAIVTTPAGRVEADQVVLALGAWAAGVRELRRAVVPVGSHIVLTEPIPERLADLGWTGGELFGDARLLVHYAQVTGDGRIAFGRGGGAVGAFGRVTRAHFVDPGSVAAVAGGFRRWFPALDDVRLTHAWGGPVDRAPGHLPFVGAAGEHANIHYGAGFSGNGVAPSAFVGAILGRRALGIRDDHTTCGLVGGPPGYLPVEPLRSIGALAVRDAVRRAEDAEDLGAEPGVVSRGLRGLVSFTTPRALEPRLWGRRSAQSRHS